MHTPNLVDNNIDRICQLFPHCISEKAKTDARGNIIKDKNGHPIIERGIDFELLKQELSHAIIDGSQERYRLDWVSMPTAPSTKPYAPVVMKVWILTPQKTYSLKGTTLMP